MRCSLQPQKELPSNGEIRLSGGFKFSAVGMRGTRAWGALMSLASRALPIVSLCQPSVRSYYSVSSLPSVSRVTLTGLGLRCDLCDIVLYVYTRRQQVAEITTALAMLCKSSNFFRIVCIVSYVFVFRRFVAVAVSRSPLVWLWLR